MVNRNDPNTARRNARADYCYDCGGQVPANEGSLWWEPGPDDGGDVVGQTPAGWRVTHLDQQACERERATRAAALEQKRADRARSIEVAEKAKQAEIDRQAAQITALLACIPEHVAAGYEWDRTVLGPGEPVSYVRLHVPENPALSGLSLGRSEWTKHVAIDGTVAYVHGFGNAHILHATRSLVERAWSQYQAGTREEMLRWMGEVGPESEHIQKERAKDPSSIFARPCAGWEARAFQLGRIDLLEREGVLSPRKG